MPWQLRYVRPGQPNIVIEFSDELHCTNMSNMPHVTFEQGTELMKHAVEMMKMAPLYGYERVVLEQTGP